MSDQMPDPYIAQTGFEEDAWRRDDFDEDAHDLDLDDVGDELDIEEDRARER